MGIDKALIGARIRSIRRSRGWRQKKLAEAVELTEQYISRIEIGKTAVTLNTIANIADVLEVDISRLVTATNTGSPDYGKYEVFALMDKATPRQRREIAAHARIVIGE